MKDALDRYVRSLAERELADEGPETTQDLGTFVDWLLERRGYQVLLRAYKYVGAHRRKSAGRLQLGVDTIATRTEDGGTIRLYRFVLKAGPIGVKEWGESDKRGAIVHDLRLAARKNLKRELEDHAIPMETTSGVTVVAVHNGDFDVETLGGSRVQLEADLREQHGVLLEWWDAADLVSLALQAPSDSTSALSGPDATLLPPRVRPFARRALDSFQIDADARRFDLETIDRLVDAALPLGRTLTQVDGALVLSEGRPIPALSLLRTITELEIVAEMLICGSRARQGGNTFPALYALELMLVRIMEYLRRSSAGDLRGHKKKIRASVEGLIERYVNVVEVLSKRLDPVLVGESSLAVPSGAEPVNYPLRVLRIGGYLATAGLALVSIANERQRAEPIASVLERLWMTNRAACDGPVTDDQVIEHALIWEFLLIMGKKVCVQSMATGVLRRSLHRRGLRRPLPALYQSARAVMRDGEMRDLVEAFIGGQLDLIEDEASTLIPLALYVAARLGDVPDEVLTNIQHHQASGKQCALQAWRCRDNGPDEWYARELHHTGTTYVFNYVPDGFRGAGYPGVTGVDEFVEAFEQFARPPATSAAEHWALPAVDRMAHKVFRTRPVLNIFVKLLQSKPA